MSLWNTSDDIVGRLKISEKIKCRTSLEIFKGKLGLEIDTSHWWLVRLKALFQLERSSLIHHFIFPKWYNSLRAPTSPDSAA